MEHDYPVANASWIADEAKILTVAYDNGPLFALEPTCCAYASIWDSTDGSLLLRIEHQRRINGAYLNHNETRFLTISEDGTAQIWEIP